MTGRFTGVSHEDSFISFLMISIGSLVVVALCLILYIIYMHWSHARYLKRKNIKHELWTPRLFEYFEDDHALASLRQTVDADDYELFAEFILFYSEIIKGDDLDKLRVIFKRFGLIDREREYLRDSFYVWRRALAAYRLGQIGAVEARDELICALDDKQNIVSYNAASALMKIGDQGSLPLVLALLLKNEVMSEELFAEIMLNYGKSITSELSDVLDIYDELPETRLMIIDYLGYYKGIESAPILIKLLQKSVDLEETIRLIKAIGNLATVETFEVLKAYLASRNPLIRSQTAKALGNLRDKNTAQVLLPLLEDEDWWCRFHAAYSILKIGEEGELILKERLAVSQDPYTRDVIGQVLSGSHGLN